MQQGKIAQPWVYSKTLLNYFSAILFIIQAAVFANIIDVVLMQHKPLNALILPLSFLILLMLSRAFISWIQEPLGFNAGTRVRIKVRQEFLTALTEIGPVRLLQENSGGTASFFLEQIEALQSFYADYLPQMLLAVLIPLTILLVVFSVDWLTGLILLITAPLIPLFMALIGMGVESANQRHFKSLARLSADFLDKLRGLITLKLFNQSKTQIDKIEKSADDYREKTMSVLRVAFLSSGTLELFSSVAIALVAILLGLTLLHKIDLGYFHQLTLAKALFILLLAPEFFLPLRQLGVHYHARAEAIAAATELLTVFSLKPAVNSNTKILFNFNPKTFSINLQNIEFAYSAKQKIFNGFNLSIQAQDKIAIVGESGVGKTTLIHLIMGFLPVNSGAIFINQQNLQEIELSQWRKSLTYLGQTPQLFHGSIRENVLLAKPKATEADVILALEKAGAMEFIKLLPAGLDTIIAEQHFGLSGGQAQRIALARVFLSNRPIVILDEPTASLDEITEQQIVAAIKKHLADKTIILISHRNATLGIADRIIELKHFLNNVA